MKHSLPVNLAGQDLTPVEVYPAVLPYPSRLSHVATLSTIGAHSLAIATGGRSRAIRLVRRREPSLRFYRLFGARSQLHGRSPRDPAPKPDFGGGWYMWFRSRADLSIKRTGFLYGGQRSTINPRLRPWEPDAVQSPANPGKHWARWRQGRSRSKPRSQFQLRPAVKRRESE